MPTIAERLQGVLTYVAKLVELSEKTVFSCRDYRSRAHSSLVYFEHELRDREGILLNLQQADGPTWLKIHRLAPHDPPPPGGNIMDWLDVSRDPKVPPKITEVRLVTMPRTDANRLVECGIVDRADVMVPPSNDPQMADVRLRLDRQPELKELVAQYTGDTWPAWAEKELIRRETIAIYNKFFEVYQTIENAGAESPTEVLVAVGVVLWRVDDKRVQHPLIELPVEIQLDQDSHAILVRPRDIEPQVYLKPFAELNNPFVEPVRQFANAYFESFGRANDNTIGGALEVSPFDPTTFAPVLRNAVGRLSERGRYYPDDRANPASRELPELTETLTITDTWAVYARPRSGNYLTRDVERLTKAADVLDDNSFPPIARKLNADPDTEPNYVPPIERPRGENGGRPTAATDACNHAFFPKPYNDAQLKIVRDLEEKDGLVVQGPPGTGKTHTIANIICHYLAKGRRVLVVSKGEPALEVLRQQIPQGIREMAMSFLTKQREGVGQLKAAAERILSVARNDREYWASLEQGADREWRNADQLRQEIDDLDAQITDLARRQLDEFVPREIAGQPPLRPEDAAKRGAEEDELYAWLDDRLGYAPESVPQFSDADIDAVRAARCRLGNDLAYAWSELPDPQDLPDAETLAHLHEGVLRACMLRERARTDGILLINPQLPNALARIEALLADLRKLARTIAGIDRAGWLRPLFLEWIGAAPPVRRLQPLDELFQDIVQTEQSREPFVARPVTLPSFGEQREMVLAAVDRASKGQRAFPLFSVGAATAKQLFARIRISGHPPRGASEWRHVHAKLRYGDEVLALTERWNAFRAEIALSLPETPAALPEVERWIAKMARALGEAMRCAKNYKDETASEMSAILGDAIDSKGAALSVDSVAKTIRLLEVNAEWARASGAESTRNGLLTRLAAFRGSVIRQMHAFIELCVGNPEKSSMEVGDGWLSLVTELRRVCGQSAYLETVDRVAALVESSGAQNWANRLRTEPASSDADAACPSDWQAAWKHHRLKAYLTAIDGQREMRRLSETKAECERRLAHAMGEVVRLKTCLGLCQTMTDARRHALQEVVAGVTYLTNTRNGALAGVWRRRVREAMPDCVRAVPCWIMPTWRVSETMPSEFGLFDLVIVDEASQSDALAVPAILRAKKLLVVGDDRQVSPTPIGIPFAKLLQLQESYLRDHPFRTALLPGGSLYDLGQRVFGQAEMLNEHFRCAEPIIRFSFQFYTQEIVPLRIPKDSERLDPPLVDVFVANGKRDARKVNRAEAVAIADEIKGLVSDPAYHDRTIGVVTLLGWEQAAEIQKLLLERLGEDAFVRHRIACGDAATFQGNERDIMFVSMVASPGKATAQTARLFEQRFNVALSRARDRMYLFRSVSLEHLSNDRDLKRKVISHFEEPMVGTLEVDQNRPESDFEREFLRRIVNLGYRVTPQVRVGDFRIDLVVEGESNRRLAVELDGDMYHQDWLHDWHRQKQMERVGWTFWRCWASSFYLDPDHCVADLVGTLDEMGIRPLGGAAPSGRYTEHRTITVDMGDEAAGGDEEDAAGETVQIGDQVLVSFEDDAQRHYLLTLKADQQDLVNGIISANDPAGQALLCKSTEDEIEIPWNGRQRRAVIVGIHKRRRRRRPHEPVPEPVATEPEPAPTPTPAPPVAPPAPPPRAGPRAPPRPPQPSPTADERRRVRQALEAAPEPLVQWRLAEEAEIANGRLGEILPALIQEGVVVSLDQHDAVRYILGSHA